MAKQSVKTARKLDSRINAYNETMKSQGNSKLFYRMPGSQNRKK